ncbi:hypothetical protein TNIN_281641 [Trichonephila inaurata madagascariensis]|uniref:Uncharacterized protein n=1 Tax=Trichonephila inaurata madagascariensis TaxID=2747483 RepID=A0A8X7CSM9_9ARAC|nr:hypothetical protein TNIN_281641 [Trichonephila inaurata madagascariensis]
MLQNPKLNIVECIEGLDNLKKYLISQRSDDNFKIFVDTAATLATDLGIHSEFPILKLRKKFNLFRCLFLSVLDSNYIFNWKDHK